ncbi:MAG TPA: molybdopterin cofactor-binding domain-containing protein [Thermoanaerobaculia bacterium]|nr:molybdopterin cofactor-binding domain-containing protein [Thermoanaerobaculia bacterium]
MTTTRRSFVKLLGGGVVVLVTMPKDLFSQQRRGPQYPDDPNAYLRIDENGRVTLFSGKIEMGQGVHTSLAQMAADELDVPLNAVTMVMGDTDACPWDAGTWGSMTTRFFGPAVRAAAAEARVVMLNLASKKLGVPRDQLKVENGVVSVIGHPSKNVTYGELAKGQQIQRLVDEKAVLKATKEWKVMGKSPKRLDAHEKITGRAQYAGDIRRPGMLYARIVRPPMHGATRKSIDFSKAKAMSGVTVVDDASITAVLAADPELAAKAIAAVTHDWDKPVALFDTETVHEYFVKNAGEGEVRVSRGNVADMAVAGGDPISSEFHTAYLAHAPMEPHTSVAEVGKDGRITVWSGTQSPFGTRARVAKELGLDEKQVRVITPYLGGGFGGKGGSPEAAEAAKLAKITGKLVMVAWSRADEFFNDTFSPAAVIKVSTAFDDTGKITHYDYSVYACGDRAAEVLYDVPNARVRTFLGRGSKVHPFGTGAWRAPGAPMNVFARESHIDIMAAAAKIDPLEFRLKNTTDKRAISVLKAAADKFGWKPGAGPSGHGRGIAVGIDSGTYCAIAAEVAVDKKTGAIRVKRVVAAQDMGQVINPEGATMQMEGCITMGLGYVLSEELRFKGGEILDTNLDTYEIARFDQLPEIETILVKNDELSPQGGGEPAIVPLGAAVGNAVFDATGVRLYRLPMTAERMKKALA